MKIFKKMLIIFLLTMFVLTISFAEVKLNLMFYKQEIKDALKEMTDAFSKKYPDIVIELENIPGKSKEVLTTRFLSGTAPEIIQLQSYQAVFEFAESGYLLDLSKENLMSKVLGSTKPAVTYKGKIYALPMDFSGMGIIYNKKIFNKYKLKEPQTYKDLKRICNTLKKKGVTPFAAMLKENWSLGQIITLLHATLTGSSDKILDWIKNMNSGKGSWADSVNVNELFGILDFYKQNIDTNAAEMGYNEQQASFANEKSAMMIQGLWAYDPVMKINPNLDCGFMPFPATNDTKNTKFFADVDSTFAISAAASPEKVEAAKKFLEWLSSEEAIKMWVEKCKLTSVFKGANLSALPQVYKDLITHADKNGSYIWEYSIYPVAVYKDACRNGTQGYLFGQKTKEDVVKYIDELWKKEISK